MRSEGVSAASSERPIETIGRNVEELQRASRTHGEKGAGSGEEEGKGGDEEGTMETPGDESNGVGARRGGVR